MYKINPALSQLVIVDMQEKLAGVMPSEALKNATKNCSILAQAASLLNVPTVLTEQYPQGLGSTLPEIKQHLPHIKVIAKTTFSACDEPKFNQQLQRENSQVILAGMEAHICVLQTALDLIALTTSSDIKPAKQIFVVEDAILSRNPASKANAIARLRDAGCIVTNTESVVFEWLGNASHPAFKTISALIR
jgi:nicotinamidase-related amidase